MDEPKTKIVGNGVEMKLTTLWLKDEEPLQIWIIGDVQEMPLHWQPTLPPSAIPTSLARCKKGQGCLDLKGTQIVVDTFASRHCDEEHFRNYESLREHVLRIKGKKKTEVFPASNQPPILHRDNLRFYRSVLLHRQGNVPILLFAFDDNAEDLDKAFWGMAVDVKTILHNPKQL